jgi:membrane protease subunit (stomatin/prohibitin family)
MSVIEFQDSTGDIMVARVPQEGTAEFVTGSQLIVQDGQVAVFFRDGRPTDGFKAGRYTLETKNLPVISKLLNIPAYGGRSPFRAYVYFVQLKTFTNLGWGTPQPILYRDKEFKAVHLRAFGAFSIRVGNPAIFLRALVGSQGIETTYGVEEWLRKFIVSRFASLLPSLLETVLDLAEKYGQIATALKQSVHDELEQYGLELVDLLVESINVPDEVQKMINRAAGTRAFADSEVGKAKDLAMADALRDSASQPGGGGMADALGLGAGLAMAQQMAASSAAAAPAAPPAPPPSAPAVQWYTSHGGQQAGPFTPSTLQSLVPSGQLTPDTYVWRQGMANWVPAGQVAELAAVFGASPPPPPPS